MNFKSWSDFEVFLPIILSEWEELPISYQLPFTKGQIKPKADWPARRAIDFSKKRTNCVWLNYVTTLHGTKIEPSACFLGEPTALQSAYCFIWPFKKEVTVLKSQNTILHPSQICILIFEPDLRIHSNASSFYRSQNIFGWSKIFVLYQKLIYILCLFQTFCARLKDHFHLINSMYVQNFLGRH